jgi:hypothetical protein
MAEAPKEQQPSLDNPDLSRAQNRRLDSLMDGAGFTAGEAWAEVAPEAKPEESPTEETKPLSPRPPRRIKPDRNYTGVHGEIRDSDRRVEEQRRIEAETAELAQVPMTDEGRQLGARQARDMLERLEKRVDSEERGSGRAPRH